MARETVGDRGNKKIKIRLFVEGIKIVFFEMWTKKVKFIHSQSPFFLNYTVLIRERLEI